MLFKPRLLKIFTKNLYSNLYTECYKQEITAPDARVKSDEVVLMRNLAKGDRCRHSHDGCDKSVTEGLPRPWVL